MRFSPRTLFTATIFLGSFLLFLVQPLIARLVLPRLGGSPSVWNTAMLFFQATLLLGYLYAHGLMRLKARQQLIVHIVLFAAAALMLPLGLAAWGEPPTASDPSLWLIGLLAVSIGPLFLVVASQAPLMQAWYARTGGSPDPYFLYAASNAGSLLALLAYPAVVEPFLRLGTQSALWSAGFVLLALLAALCGIRLLKAPAEELALAPAEDPAAPIAWRTRLYWIALAAVPSGLLISTTTHLTTDITAMPLLWVLPLAIYLLTFIIAFAENAAPFVRHAQRAAPLLLLVLGSYAFLASGSVAFLIASADLVLLFYVALALHGRLAEARPAPSRLTGFYLSMSFGGMLGGLFCALVAPVIFDWDYEHPILLIAAAALLPATPIFASWRRPSRLLHMLLLASLPLSYWAGQRLLNGAGDELAAVGVGLLALAAVIAIGRRVHFAGQLALLMLALGGWRTIDISMMEGARFRSFFGIYAIQREPERAARILMHGTTLHGTQSQVPALMNQPMTYYAPPSGVGRAFAAAPRLFGQGARMGFVGLGTGTLACYAKPGQRWTAFEIDPTIVRIARDPKLFSYIERCKPDLRIVLGDARQTIAKETPGGLDMLALDAFSSDAIPLHLMTTQAFAAYARVLSRDGVLLVHISNRHLDLQPVVAAIAAQSGWFASIYRYRPAKRMPSGLIYTKSDWIALTRTPERLAELQRASGDPAGWFPLEKRKGLHPWTDDFAAVLPVFKF